MRVNLPRFRAAVNAGRRATVGLARKAGGRWPEAILAFAVVFLLFVAGRSAVPRLEDTATIRIAAGEIPPHMDYSGTGREAEIIRAALRQGYGSQDIEFYVGPFSRHWEMFKRDVRLSAVTTVPDNLALSGFSSKDYIDYQNGIIYRRTDFPRGLGSNPVESLSGERVVGFAGAAGIIPGLQGMIPKFRSYAEYDDQYVHSAMLIRRYADVVLADRLIIDAYDREIAGPQYRSISADFVFYPVFCPTHYHMVFRNDAMRNAFDRGLAAIKESGELDRINARYRNATLIEQVPPPRLRCG